MLSNLPLAVCLALLFSTLMPAAAETTRPAADASAALAAARERQAYTALYVHHGPEQPAGDLWESYEAVLADDAFPDEVASAVLDLADEQQAALIDELGLEGIDAPVVLLVAPNGAITGGNAEEVDIGMIRSGLVPALDQAIILAFQRQRGVLLCIGIGDAAADEPAQAGVDAALSQAVVSGSFDKIAVPPGMAGRDALLANLRLPAQPEQPITMLLMPPGRIAGLIHGPTERDAIFGLIARAQSSGGGCCP
ncbi:MAG: hypothetical protein ACOCXA_01485 [Planctomycetota bacterium]